ncbi:MAG: DUF3500 domain-containing protein [Phycisphaeraceae bacterium]
MNTYTAAALFLSALFVVGCQTQEQQDQKQVQTFVALDDDVAIPANDAFKPSEQMAKRTRAAAVALLASLDEGQREKAARPIRDPLRKDWHFIPRDREGLALGEMSVQQKTLVHALMQTALSDSGYLKATDIIWLETVLYEMSNQNPMRDPGKYMLVIFGDPADLSAAWGWRLEGHHLSINLTYTPEAIGVTPLFFGTNPAVVPAGPLAGKRVLADAHHLAVAFAKSMSDDQRKQMMLAQKPRDVITGPGREKVLDQHAGLLAKDMTDAQQADLLRLLWAHWGSLDSDHARDLYWRVVNLFGDAPILHDYSFAWAGPIDADKPFYYRIRGERFLVEYSCQGKNHVHAVIHDLTDPLQEDLLKKHFEQHEH